jgi:predicted nucleic acid-binding protein
MNPNIPQRIFLDTNIYIIGVANENSYERKILELVGFLKPSSIEIIVSEELLDQILRVSKRLHNKDWGSQIVARIWQQLQVIYVNFTSEEWLKIEELGLIPREDIGVYLTASKGETQCFVSSNYKLIRCLVQETKEFECLTPQEFVNKYLS